MHTIALAVFAVAMRFEDFPGDGCDCARDCIQDAIGGLQVGFALVLALRSDL